MVLTVVVGIACLLLGFLISLLIKTTKIKQKNQEIEKEEQQLRLDIKDAQREYDNLINNFITEQQKQEATLKEDYQKWKDKKNSQNLEFIKAETKLKENIANLDGQIEQKKKSINELDLQAKEAVKLVEEQVLDNAANTIEQQGKVLTDKYEKLESELLLHYVSLNDEKWDEYAARDEELGNRILQKENELEELRSKAAAAIEVNKRMELERQEKDFYRLQLSDIDLEEIKRIRSIEPYLRKKEPLNKVVWKVYYEKPYTDLIGRVIGTGRHTGIYKITNIENGMCYVGQATDLAERWKQHIKRGIGADPPTQNKLYPAMLSFGVENFTFEIVEQCDNAHLTEREKYWTDFYKAQEFGYSIRKG